MRLAFKLAWSFIIKSYKQSLLIVLTIITGIASVVFVISLASSLDRMVSRFGKDNFPDILVRYLVHGDPYFKVNKEFKEAVLSHDEVEKFNFFFTPGTTILVDADTNLINEDLKTLGFDNFDGFTFFDITNNIVKGTLPTNTNEMIVADHYFEKSNLKLNQNYHATFFSVGRKAEIKIVGTFKPLTYNVHENLAYFVDDTFYQENVEAARLYFRIKDGVDLRDFYNNTLKPLLEEYYPNIDYYEVYWDSEVPYLETIGESQTIFLIVMELFISLVVFLLSSSLLTHALNKKQKTIGTLRALGYQNNYLYLSFFIETIILTLVASLIGIFFSHFGLNVFQTFMTDKEGRALLEVIKSGKLYLNAVLIVSVVVVISSLVTLRKMKNVPLVELIKRS
ncbi:MAG: FtsX-like permease family protein [Acholeplasmataceae bacterium]|nr:FtsX-like permease family protein [Acholeplasmataceae bacterium]HHT39921.1 FtsX-like permease family protein [Acholeplasmataceae bacterium]